MEDNPYDEFGNYIGPELSENVRFTILLAKVYRQE